MTRLSKPQRVRLEKLATYLESLPEDYGHFDMGDYTGHDPRDNAILEYARKNGGVASCGTVACALGHGPAAGILVPPRFLVNARGLGEVQWGEYGALFGMGAAKLYDPVYEWLFAPGWRFYDNSHYGAAARIRYMLADGIPENNRAGGDQLPIYAPYRIDARAEGAL